MAGMGREGRSREDARAKGRMRRMRLISRTGTVKKYACCKKVLARTSLRVCRAARQTYASIGSLLVSLRMMYLLRSFPSAAYHCVTKGAIHMTSPACTEYHASLSR